MPTGTRIDPKMAEKVMLKAKFKPLEPFTRSHDKWKCLHTVCGEIVYVVYGDVRRNNAACSTCKKRNGSHRRIPEKDAVSLMLKARLKPLEPYKDATSKWKCECLNCGLIVFPKYNWIQQGDGGCVICRNKKVADLERKDEKIAIAIMLEAQLRPLETYKRSTARWKCECLKCKKIVFPAYGNVAQGHSGCVYCYPAGFSMVKPSYLYIITNDALNAHKVGIGNVKKINDRIKSFNYKGWDTYKVWKIENGSKALKIEKAVFKVLRKDLKLPPFLSKEQIPKIGGHTETVNADSITLLQLEKIIKKVIKGYRNNP